MSLVSKRHLQYFYLCLTAANQLRCLQFTRFTFVYDNIPDVDTLWSAEVAGFMLESAPAQPFDDQLSSLDSVEASMKIRRQEIAKLLAKDECLMTLTSFPRLGAPDFTWPIHKPQPDNEDSFGRSSYFPDEAAFQKIPGNRVWSRNIREKRGEKVKITPSIFRDENTQIPVDGAPVDKPDAVLMDATYFGFSCCALQVTVQVCIDHSNHSTYFEAQIVRQLCNQLGITNTDLFILLLNEKFELGTGFAYMRNCIFSGAFCVSNIGRNCIHSKTFF